MLPAVEPHVLEGDERVPFCDELQQSFDVICVDVSQNQQFEFPLIPGRAEKRCFSAAWVLWRPPSTRMRRGLAVSPYSIHKQSPSRAGSISIRNTFTFASACRSVGSL